MIPVPEYQYKGDDAKFNESKFVEQLYMNSIDESGRRYDVARHVKRTSKYFSPKEEFLASAAELEDIIQGDEADSSDILLFLEGIIHDLPLESGAIIHLSDYYSVV